ncbi:MAG: hypothetical protein AB7O52_01740 [Planctomycetota bacterium]
MRPTVLAFVLGCCLLQPPAHAQSANDPTRKLPYGDRLLPVFQPTWAPRNPLEVIEEWLHDDPVGAADAIQRVVLELAGCLLAPTECDVAAPWLRVPGAAAALRQLVAAERFARLPVAGDDEFPWPENPIFWYPPAAPAAGRAFDFAFEDGDLLEALRLATSANRPEGLSRELVSWIARSCAPPPSTMHSTFPDASSGPRPRPAPAALSLDFQLVLTPPRGSETDLLSNPWEDQSLATDAEVRALPLAEFYPLASPDLVMLSVGSRILTISNEDSPQLIGQSRHSDFGATLFQAHAPTAGGDYLAFLVRRPVSQDPQVVMTELGRPPLGRERISEGFEGLAFNRIELLRQTNAGGSYEPVPQRLAAVVEEATAGATVCAPPRFADGCLYVLISRGWTEVQFEVIAIDLARAEVRWQRPLGVTKPLLSLNDFRGMQRRGQLEPVGSDLVVIHDGGWITRVDRSTGGLCGVLGYPRHTMRESLHTASGFSFKGVEFKNFPAWRGRYLGPIVPLDLDRDRPGLLFLPPDSRHLLLIDLVDWRVRWFSGELTATTLFTGVQDGVAVLLDCGVPRAGNELTLRRIDWRSGAELPSAKLELEARIEAAKDHWWLATSPLLVGVPRLVGRELWIPTLAGLETWDVVAPGEPSHRVVPWPNGAFGGTLVPLPGERWASIGRGVPELRRPSVLEIFSAAD